MRPSIPFRFRETEAECNQINPWQLTCEAPPADAEGSVDITVSIW